MRRPSFQFYPADWRANANLRRCSRPARGVWMDVLCILHENEDAYGQRPWTLEDIAMAADSPLELVQELARKEVLKGSDTEHVEFVYTPRHAGQDGEPVTLIDTKAPLWFSSRMVRDEYVRSRRGAGTQFTTEKQPQKSPVRKPKRSPTRTIGDGKGDGPSSSTSSSSTVQKDSHSSNENSTGPSALVPAAGLKEPFVLLPTNVTDQTFPITVAKVAEFSMLYPAVDVEAEMRKILGWLINNEKKRKTKTGMLKFVNSWLSRQQDEGSRNGRPANNAPRESAHTRLIAGAAAAINQLDGEQHLQGAGDAVGDQESARHTGDSGGAENAAGAADQGGDAGGNHHLSHGAGYPLLDAGHDGKAESFEIPGFLRRS